jgi:hypothetical protein
MRASSNEGPIATEAQGAQGGAPDPAMNTQLRVGPLFPAPALIVQCDPQVRDG